MTSTTFGAAPSTTHEASQLAALRLPLGAWLRLLWNVTPPLLHLPATVEGDAAPFLAATGVHLPSAPFDPADPNAVRWYSAAAAHAAAHIVFSRRIFQREGTAPITQALIGVLEDARVEAMACRELPGLRRLWATMHTASPDDGDDFETLLLRLSRALLDPAYDDPHPWIRKGKARFYLDGSGEVLAQAQPAGLRGMASALGHDLGQMRMAFHARAYRPGPCYRDDNRWLWQGGGGDSSGKPQPLASDRGREGKPDATPPAPLQWHYDEWDRLIGRARPAWCTVHERLPQIETVRSTQASDPDPALRARLTALMRKAASRPTGWRRRERDGEDIEIEAAVRASVATLSGHAGEARVHRRQLRSPARTAAALLVDCSASSATVHGASGLTRLAEAQETARVLAGAMGAAGWSVALHAFNSDGRQAVNCWRVKNFDEPWDELAVARLQALQSGLSTRLGAALRHASRALTLRPADRRLLLVLGDGEPHDIDIHDPQYLVEDARQAVQCARQADVRCLGLLIDAEEIAASQRIFGVRHVGVVPDTGALVGVLAQLLARLGA